MLAIGWTLAFYFARRFAVMVLAIFLFFVMLIGGITYLEYLTRSLRADEFDALQVFLLTTFRVPSICEDVLPFTTLFGSIAAFVIANRRLEVVVARAAGISAWQFLLPACIVGLLFGVISTTLYNPASTVMRGWADTLQAKLLSSGRVGGAEFERSGLAAPSGGGPRIDHRRAAVIRAWAGPCGGDGLHLRRERTVPGARRRADRPFLG